LKIYTSVAQVMVDDIDGDEEGIVDVVLDDNAIRQVSK
jgi:hypothetical protein